MSRTVLAPLVPLLASAALAGGPPPLCTDPVLPCQPGWLPLQAQFSDRYGTTSGLCDTCSTAPGTPGCVHAEWTTQVPNPTAPQLSIPKFVPAGGLVRLAQVELVVRARTCGVVGIENTDPLNGCIDVASIGFQLDVSPAPGQGLPPGIAWAFSVDFSTPPIALSAYDGTTDSGGTSGTTVTFNETTSESCFRITDPAQLAAFVGSSGSDAFFFDHSAASTSMSSGCAPQSFTSDAFASLELEVRYRSCIAPDTTFCFGSDAVCPCGNGGNADRGCDNAQATGGVRLTASGDPGLNTVVLHGTGFPASTSPAVLALRSPSAPSVPLPFGDGLLCLPTAGAPSRVSGTRASGGASAHPLDHVAGAGSFDYQLWYRNRPASFCNPTAAFNASSAIRIEWP